VVAEGVFYPKGVLEQWKPGHCSVTRGRGWRAWFPFGKPCMWAVCVILQPFRVINRYLGASWGRSVQVLVVINIFKTFSNVSMTWEISENTFLSLRRPPITKKYIFGPKHTLFGGERPTGFEKIAYPMQFQQSHFVREKCAFLGSLSAFDEPEAWGKGAPGIEPGTRGRSSTA
jgi:hypothetical protein